MAAERRDNEAIARAYLRALERNDVEAVASVLDPHVRHSEFPNRLTPAGAESDKDGMLAGMRRGASVVREQRFEVLNVLAQGDSLALEVNWSAVLAIPLGQTLPAGSTIRARFAVFLEFVDGRIVRQRNYDCFDPW